MRQDKEFTLKKYFFYRVPKEEKKRIRQKIMVDDYKSLNAILIVVFCLQVAMLIRSVIHYGFVVDGKQYVLLYRYLYAFLGICCPIALVLAKDAYNKKKELYYFIIQNTMIVVIALWAAGIVIVDSYQHIDLTTLAYSIMVLPLFLIIEPWICAIDFGVILIGLDLYFYLSPQAAFFTEGTLINSISIFILFTVACTFSFYKRIKKLNLEFEINNLNKLLARKATIDDLTGLYNRNYLTSALKTPLNENGLVNGIMMVDVDSFKKINDNYGHGNGDKVLEALGKIILKFMENKGYAIRYGGEEFLLYFHDVNKNKIYKLAEELRTIIENNVISIDEDSVITYTVSIGAAIGSTNLSYSGLISLADKALYTAKHTKNTVCLYDKKMEQ